MSVNGASVITQVTQDEEQGPNADDKTRWSFFGLLSCCRSNRSAGGDLGGIPGAGSAPALLPPALPQHAQRKCLVLDLDETLVHSSFKPVPDADFIVPVEIEDQTHQVYVLKRPNVDEFMRRVGELFEVVVFTASVAKYADPVLDLLDVHHAVHYRLFREGCVHHQGSFVKDLSRLGRDLAITSIVDNSAASYLFHPQNAIPIETWFDDRSDNELMELLPFLEEMAAADDVRVPLKARFGLS